MRAASSWSRVHLVKDWSPLEPCGVRACEGGPASYCYLRHVKIKRALRVTNELPRKRA